MIAGIIQWARDNWLGAVVFLLLGVFLGSFGASKSGFGTSVNASAGALQSVSGTASAHSGAVIEIPGRPAQPCPPDKICPECPPVRIVYDCTSIVSGGATQAASATVQVSSDQRNWVLAAGGSVRLSPAWTPVDGSMDLFLGYRDFRVRASYLASRNYEVGVSKDLLKF